MKRYAVALERRGSQAATEGEQSRPSSAPISRAMHHGSLPTVGIGRKKGAKGGRQRASVVSARNRFENEVDAARVRGDGLPEHLRHLFPGYHFGDITLPDQSDLVMLHILSQGGPDDVCWLVRSVGNPTIREWIVRHRGRGLTVRQMTPWVAERAARKWQRTNPLARLWEER